MSGKISYIGNKSHNFQGHEDIKSIVQSASGNSPILNQFQVKLKMNKRIRPFERITCWSYDSTTDSFSFEVKGGRRGGYFIKVRPLEIGVVVDMSNGKTLIGFT